MDVQFHLLRQKNRIKQLEGPSVSPSVISDNDESIGVVHGEFIFDPYRYENACGLCPSHATYERHACIVIRAGRYN